MDVSSFPLSFPPLSPISTLTNTFKQAALFSFNGDDENSPTGSERRPMESPPMIQINTQIHITSFETSPDQKSGSESGSPYKTPKRCNSAPIISRDRSVSLSSFNCLKKRKIIPKPRWADKENHHSTDEMKYDVELIMPTREVVQDIEPKASLPTITGSHPDLYCISPSTLTDVLDGRYSNHFDTVYIIDCRFAYEYEGGHVKGAINIPDSKDIGERFISNPLSEKRIAIIFYCEFSSKRGPRGYRTLRALDRQANEASYPNLYYPDVYLLEGGYKNYYSQYKNKCDPQEYVEMTDSRFFVEMNESCKELRQGTWKRSRSLTNFTSATLTSIKKEYLS